MSTTATTTTEDVFTKDTVRAVTDIGNDLENLDWMLNTLTDMTDILIFDVCLEKVAKILLQLSYDDRFIMLKAIQEAALKRKKELEDEAIKILKGG